MAEQLSIQPSPDHKRLIAALLRPPLDGELQFNF
jgi:hypothetical protein